MLDELGLAISSHLRELLPAGTEVSLDPPSDIGPGPRSSGTVSLFLHQVLENQDQGGGGLWTEERDPDGRVVSRTSPEKRYDFCYLISAWSTSLELELGLLGSVLRSIAHSPLLPAARLTGSLAQARGPVNLSVGRPCAGAAQPELWSIVGLQPRICLDLVATAPVPPVVQTDLARPPETIDLGVGGPSAVPMPGTPKPAVPGTRGTPGATGRHPGRPTARITEGALDGRTRGEAG